MHDFNVTPLALPCFVSLKHNLDSVMRLTFSQKRFTPAVVAPNYYFCMRWNFVIFHLHPIFMVRRKNVERKWSGRCERKREDTSLFVRHFFLISKFQVACQSCSAVCAWLQMFCFEQFCCFFCSVACIISSYLALVTMWSSLFILLFFPFCYSKMRLFCHLFCFLSY